MLDGAKDPQEFVEAEIHRGRLDRMIVKTFLDFDGREADVIFSPPEQLFHFEGDAAGTMFVARVGPCDMRCCLVRLRPLEFLFGGTM